MGFPFDRVAKKNDGSLAEFLLPNMKTVECKILFTDEVIERGKLVGPSKAPKNEVKN